MSHSAEYETIGLHTRNELVVVVIVGIDVVNPRVFLGAVELILNDVGLT